MATAPLETADAFDAAFASFAGGGDAPPAPAPVDPDPAPAPAAVPAADAGGDGGAGGAGDPAPADPGVADAGDAGGAPAAGDPALEPTEDAATDALIAKLAKLTRDAPAAEPAPVPATSATPDAAPAIYSAEEQEVLQNYEKDWPDVAKAEALKRRAEYRDIVGYVFQQVADQLRPVFETVELLSTRTHLSDLRTQVEDYDTVRDKVVSWVGEQPTYLQVGMKQVIQSGTPDEVADLIGRYRSATGDAARIPTEPAVKKVAELSSDAKQAAQALAPVSTKRSALPQGDDPNDFDSAFAQWAGKKQQ